jgi:plastocyanin
MGATPGGSGPGDWRVKVQAGDKVTVHTTYDSNRADWYEVMGIMPVAVYNGTDVGGKDAQDPTIPQADVLTHGHLAENDNHGGVPTNSPDLNTFPSAPPPNGTVNVKSFTYQAIPGTPSVPTVEPGKSLTFKSLDTTPSVNAFHTITACKAPCTATTGIAYPVADGPVTFDSGELGFNGNQGSLPGAPAADRDTWQTPKDLPSGTYTYFCRIHPFMRGAFRVESQSDPIQRLRAKKKQAFGKAAVTDTVDKAGTVKLQAKLKPMGAAGSRALSRALDAKRSSVNLNANAKTKIKLKFSRAARHMVRAEGGRWKVIVTATATSRFGRTSTAKTRFSLTG